ARSWQYHRKLQQIQYAVWCHDDDTRQVGPSMSMLSVRVWRGGSASGSRRVVAYDVPRHSAQTVLDVVTHIQRRLDPTLAYRFACRVGMWRSCALTVNGPPRSTCRPSMAQRG